MLLPYHYTLPYALLKFGPEQAKLKKITQKCFDFFRNFECLGKQFLRGNFFFAFDFLFLVKVVYNQKVKFEKKFTPNFRKTVEIFRLFSKIWCQNCFFEFYLLIISNFY